MFLGEFSCRVFKHVAPVIGGFDKTLSQVMKINRVMIEYPQFNRYPILSTNELMCLFVFCLNGLE